MKRIVTLGVAVVMALTLTAFLGAASASASWLVSENQSISGAPIGTHQFKGSPQSVNCSGSNFTGTVPGGAAAWLETSQLNEAGSCAYFGAYPKMQFNKCRLVFYPGKEVAAGQFDGKVLVGPSGCGPWTISYMSGACQINYLPNTGVAATFQNVGTGSSASVTVSINTSEVASTFGCAGEKHSNTPASFSGSWSLQSASGVRVAATVPQGLEIAENIAGEPELQAEVYPATIVRKLTKAMQFAAPGLGTASCPSPGESWGTLGKASSEVPLDFTFQNCKAFGFGVSTVTLGSWCQLALAIDDTGAPYTGVLELQCTDGTKGLTITPKFLGADVCTVRIPPQTLGTVALQNLGSESSKHVAATVTGSKIKYTEGCGSPGGEDGTFSTAFDLSALK